MSGNGVTFTVAKSLADRKKLTHCSPELRAAVAMQHLPSAPRARPDILAASTME